MPRHPLNSHGQWDPQAAAGGTAAAARGSDEDGETVPALMARCYFFQETHKIAMKDVEAQRKKVTMLEDHKRELAMKLAQANVSIDNKDAVIVQME